MSLPFTLNRYFNTCQRSHAGLIRIKRTETLLALLHFMSSPPVLLEIVQTRNAFDDVVAAIVLFKNTVMTFSLQEELTVAQLIKTFPVKCQGLFLCLTLFVGGRLFVGVRLGLESLH